MTAENYPEHNDQSFMTLTEYLEAAERAIRYWMPKIRPSLTNKLSQDEDTISLVAYAMMIADWKWRDGAGRAKRSYRNDYASFALRTLVKRQSKIPSYEYLEDELFKNNDKTCRLKDSIVDHKAEEPLSILIGSTKQNRLKKIRQAMEDQTLTQKERVYMREYYHNDKTYLQIGKELGVSKQCVQQSIVSAKNKLKSIV